MHAQAATQWRQRIDAALERSLPAADEPPRRLHAAMRHAALLGGKRMRPLMVYANGTAFGAEIDALEAQALAVELIHAYSRVHDDMTGRDEMGRADGGTRVTKEHLVGRHVVEKKKKREREEDYGR